MKGVRLQDSPPWALSPFQADSRCNRTFVCLRTQQAQAHVSLELLGQLACPEFQDDQEVASGGRGAVPAHASTPCTTASPSPRGTPAAAAVAERWRQVQLAAS